MFEIDFREILWSIAFLRREKFVIVARCQREFTTPILLVPARFLSTARNWILRSLHIYITIREIPIKMQWKFVSNVVCLIAEFSSFSASCNMPFRITKMLFLLPYIISSISSFFNFFSYFFIYFLEFFSLLKFPHSYNSTRFSRGRITAEQDCERINSNFGNIQE